MFCFFECAIFGPILLCICSNMLYFCQKCFVLENNSLILEKLVILPPTERFAHKISTYLDIQNNGKLAPMPMTNVKDSRLMMDGCGNCLR